METYRVVARIMDGKSCVGYMIQSNVSNESKPVSRNNLVKLCEYNAITNVICQTSNGKPIFRGKGMKFSSIPDIRKGQRDETVKLKPTYKYSIVGVCRCNGKVVGYDILDKESNKAKPIMREDVMRLAAANLIDNANTQNYNGGLILRGRGTNLNNIKSREIRR